MTLPTEPGIYRNISWEDYNRIPAVRRSFLWDLFQEGPGYAKFRESEPRDSDALRFGEMFHISVLQPEELMKRYVLLPAFELNPNNVDRKGKRSTSKNTTWYQDHKAGFEEQCVLDGKQIVKEDDRERAYQMGIRLRDHQALTRFFGRGPSNEAVALWKDPSTGVLVKTRYDSLVETGLATVVELKSDRKPRAPYFRRTLWWRGYYFQAACYLRGLTVLGIQANFLFAVAENMPPYRVYVHQFDRDDRKLGDEHVESALRQYAYCTRENHWPLDDGKILPLKMYRGELEDDN